MISRIRLGSSAVTQPKQPTATGADATTQVPGYSAASSFEPLTAVQARRQLEPSLALVRIGLRTHNDASLLKGARSLATALDVSVPESAQTGVETLTAVGRVLVGPTFEFHGASDLKALQHEAVEALCEKHGGINDPDPS